MDRLLKVLTSHSAAVDSLEKKLNEISAVKKKKRGAEGETYHKSESPDKPETQDQMF